MVNCRILMNKKDNVLLTVKTIKKRRICMYQQIKPPASKQTRDRCGLFLFGLLFLFLIYFIIPGISAHAQVSADDQQKSLKYEIDVNAQIIPVFAVTTGGEPVFDLNAEDIELSVNGKPTKIASFAISRVEGDQGSSKIDDDDQKRVESQGRINFIIFDSVSNSQKGLRRGKEIALGIIKESPKTDAFVLLESNPKSGLRYVAGPDNDKNKLAKEIKNVVKIAGQRYFSYFGFRSSEVTLGEKPRRANEDSRSYRERLFKIAMDMAEADKKEYQKQVMIFLHSLSQMKFALKTITQPRMVFLISGGIPTSSLGINVVSYYKFMGNTAKAINYGGSVLYMINPIPAKDDSSMSNDRISQSLKFMADESGGKYFAGSDLKKIVTRVKKHTRAYYELAFYPGDGNKPKDDKLRINLNCKRKGVIVNTVNYSERGKPYREMETMQKKLFALSVVTGGSWSRIVGKVKKVKFKKLKRGKNRAQAKMSTANAKHKNAYISIPIPENMRKPVDVFVVNLEPETMKANIGVSRQEVTETLEMEVPVVDGKQQYVVIVEPQKTRCLYNQVL